jgi:DNA gyrase subunit A
MTGEAASGEGAEEEPSPEELLSRCRRREHVLVAIGRAQANWPEFVDLVTAADSATQARQRLCAEFDLDEGPANAILDMQLRRASALERAQIDEELTLLRQEIVRLTDGSSG